MVRKSTKKSSGIMSVGILSYCCIVQAMRVPDEGKLPVSWLAGNQGEYATSTEVNKIETFVILNVKTFFL